MQRLIRSTGMLLAAGLAFGGQFLLSMRGAPVMSSIAPGIGLYAAAIVLLGVTLFVSRRDEATPAPGSPADGSAPGGVPAAGAIDRWLDARGGLILLLVILAAGIYLRLYRIDAIPWGLNNDEAINAIEVREIVAGKPFSTVTARGLNRETMFHYLAALSYKSSGATLNVLRAIPAVFGLEPRIINDPMADMILPLRMVSIVVGTLTILALFLFARVWFGTRTALMASLFLAVSPWHLLYSRAGLRTILSPLFTILTIGLFLRALRTGRRRDHLAWGLAAGFGFWTYTSFRAIPLALIAFLVLRLLFKGWRTGAQSTGARSGLWLLAGGGVAALLFIVVMAWSHMTPAEFLFRGAYATTPPQSRYGANLVHAVTMLNYYPESYAVIQNDAFISDGVSATFGEIGLEPDTLILAALATLGLLCVAWQALRRPASAIVLLCLLAVWLTVGWMGPSLTRLLINLPWLCLCAALFVTRACDGLAALRPPRTAWAAAIVLPVVAAIGCAEGFSNYFLLAGKSERAMQHFGATQTIMGMFVRALPPDQSVVVLHTLRVDTLKYLIGDRPNVQLLTDTTKVSLESVVSSPRTTTFVIEYARPFAEPVRALIMRFPQGDMSQVADARFDPDKPIFFSFTLWKDAAGQIMPAPGSVGTPPPPPS